MDPTKVPRQGNLGETSPDCGPGNSTQARQQSWYFVRGGMTQPIQMSIMERRG